MQKILENDHAARLPGRFSKKVVQKCNESIKNVKKSSRFLKSNEKLVSKNGNSKKRSKI
jgi:hypothetical protein